MKASKGERAGGHEPRASVVTVSCPQCGAQVKGAEPGRKNACSYCGTELLVPRITLPADDLPRGGSLDAASRPPKPRLSLRTQLLVCGGSLLVFALVILYQIRSFHQNLDAIAAPTAAAVETPKPDLKLARERCLKECGGSCVAQHPRLQGLCQDNCQRTCKLAGTTREECLAGCKQECKQAPNPTAVSDCEQACGQERCY